MQLICVICGKEYDGHGHSMTCSEECRTANRRKWEREKKKIRLVQQVCQGCGIEFTKQRRSGRKFCSIECRKLHGNYKGGVVGRKEKKKEKKQSNAEFRAELIKLLPGWRK